MNSPGFQRLLQLPRNAPECAGHALNLGAPTGPRPSQSPHVPKSQRCHPSLRRVKHCPLLQSQPHSCREPDPPLICIEGGHRGASLLARCPTSLPFQARADQERQLGKGAFPPLPESLSRGGGGEQVGLGENGPSAWLALVRGALERKQRSAGWRASDQEKALALMPGRSSGAELPFHSQGAFQCLELCGLNTQRSAAQHSTAPPACFSGH